MDPKNNYPNSSSSSPGDHSTDPNKLSSNNTIPDDTGLPPFPSTPPSPANTAIPSPNGSFPTDFSQSQPINFPTPSPSALDSALGVTQDSPLTAPLGGWSNLSPQNQDPQSIPGPDSGSTPTWATGNSTGDSSNIASSNFPNNANAFSPHQEVTQASQGSLASSTPEVPGISSPTPESAPNVSSSIPPWVTNNGPLSTPETGVPLESGPSGTPEAPVPVEAAPTDLSHLVGSPNSAEVTTSPAPTVQPETLVVVPQSSQQDAQQVVTGSGAHGFPKLILLAGVLVVLLVAGGSAYFILGVGKPEVATTSTPAIQPPLTNPPRTLMPSPSEPSSPSANFGDITGGRTNVTEGLSPTNGATTSGTSALEMLRQRNITR